MCLLYYDLKEENNNERTNHHSKKDHTDNGRNCFPVWRVYYYPWSFDTRRRFCRWHHCCRLFHPADNKEQSSLIESIAILGFLLLALAGLVLTTRVFFKNFLPEGIPGNLVSAGTIPVYNIVVGIEVAAALISVFMAFIIFKAED